MDDASTEIDWSTLQQEIESASAAVKAGQTSLSKQMREDLQHYLDSTGEVLYWAQRPSIPVEELCVSCCSTIGFALIWLALVGGWTALGWLVIMPSSSSGGLLFCLFSWLLTAIVFVDAVMRQSKFASTYYALTDRNVIWAHTAYACHLRACTCGPKIKRIPYSVLAMQPQLVGLEGAYNLKLYRQFPISLFDRMRMKMALCCRRRISKSCFPAPPRAASEPPAQTDADEEKDYVSSWLEARGFDFITNAQMVHQLFQLLACANLISEDTELIQLVSQMAEATATANSAVAQLDSNCTAVNIDASTSANEIMLSPERMIARRQAQNAAAAAALMAGSLDADGDFRFGDDDDEDAENAALDDSMNEEENQNFKDDDDDEIKMDGVVNASIEPVMAPDKSTSQAISRSTAKKHVTVLSPSEMHHQTSPSKTFQSSDGTYAMKTPPRPSSLPSSFIPTSSSSMQQYANRMTPNSKPPAWQPGSFLSRLAEKSPFSSAAASSLSDTTLQHTPRQERRQLQSEFNDASQHAQKTPKPHSKNDFDYVPASLVAANKIVSNIGTPKAPAQNPSRRSFNTQDSSMLASTLVNDIQNPKGDTHDALKDRWADATKNQNPYPRPPATAPSNPLKQQSSLDEEAARPSSAAAASLSSSSSLSSSKLPSASSVFSINPSTISSSSSSSSNLTSVDAHSLSTLASSSSGSLLPSTRVAPLPAWTTPGQPIAPKSRLPALKHDITVSQLPRFQMDELDNADSDSQPVDPLTELEHQQSQSRSNKQPPSTLDVFSSGSVTWLSKKE